MNVFTLVFVRSGVSLVFLAPLVHREGWTASFQSNKPGFHVLRAALGCGALACTYYAYRKLPLALATTIGFTQPLILTVFSLFFLKESLTWGRWIALFVGYAGVLILAVPTGGGACGELEPIIIAFLANVLSSGAIITAKHLTKTDSTVTLLVYFSLAVFCLSGIFFGYDHQPIQMDDAKILVLIGGLAMLSQFSYMRALKHANASTVAPFEYLRLVFAIPIGIIFFHEKLELKTILGACVIIATSFYLTRQKKEAS